MRISNLIEKLEEIKNKVGDVNVAITDGTTKAPPNEDEFYLINRKDDDNFYDMEEFFEDNQYFLLIGIC